MSTITTRSFAIFIDSIIIFFLIYWGTSCKKNIDVTISYSSCEFLIFINECLKVLSGKISRAFFIFLLFTSIPTLPGVFDVEYPNPQPTSKIFLCGPCESIISFLILLVSALAGKNG